MAGASLTNPLGVSCPLGVFAHSQGKQPGEVEDAPRAPAAANLLWALAKENHQLHTRVYLALVASDLLAPQLGYWPIKDSV